MTTKFLSKTFFFVNIQSTGCSVTPRTKSLAVKKYVIFTPLTILHYFLFRLFWCSNRCSLKKKAFCPLENLNFSSLFKTLKYSLACRQAVPPKIYEQNTVAPEVEKGGWKSVKMKQCATNERASRKKNDNRKGVSSVEQVVLTLFSFFSSTLSLGSYSSSPISGHYKATNLAE